MDPHDKAFTTAPDEFRMSPDKFHQDVTNLGILSQKQIQGLFDSIKNGKLSKADVGAITEAVEMFVKEHTLKGCHHFTKDPGYYIRKGQNNFNY